MIPSSTKKPRRRRSNQAYQGALEEYYQELFARIRNGELDLERKAQLERRLEDLLSQTSLSKEMIFVKVACLMREWEKNLLLKRVH